MADGSLLLGLSPVVEIVNASKTVNDIVSEKVRFHDDEGIEDPFYIINLSDVLLKHEKWTRLFPRVKPFYAVKCLDDEIVLRLLANLGSGFDCASKSEISKVLDLGVSADRIIYANTCKQRDMLSYARDHGVCLTTFDNEEELHKLKATSPAAELLLRILPPATDKVLSSLGGKFGCPPLRVRPLLEIARSLGLKVVGLSFHVGSGCFYSAAFSKAVVAAATAAEVAREVGFTVSVLDIGGGFPGQTNVAITIEEIAAAMMPALDEHFPESGGVRLIAEPGRFFVASAVQLTAKVIGKRLDYGAAASATAASPAANGDDSSPASAVPSLASYYINDGVYCSFLCAKLENLFPSPVLLSSKARGSQRERMLPSMLYGPTCDGCDVLLKEAALPEAFVDDWMSFANMGAYTLTLTTRFNGMPTPRLYYVAFTDARWLLASKG